MGREATCTLERGVRVTGTDGWSWDAPFIHTKERYARTGDAGLIWEGIAPAWRSATATSRSCTIPRRCRPRASGCCFPFNISAFGRFTRAVAILEA